MSARFVDPRVRTGMVFALGLATAGNLELTARVMACPLCARQTVIETVKRRSGRDWSEVAELGRTVPIPAGLDVRRAYGPSHRPG